MISKTIAKLRDLEYRKGFVSSQINIGIAFQVRALMKSRGWKQEVLAERTGMLQPRISAIQTPGKVRPNIETLRRIAEAFDCALVVRFVPFSELVLWSEQFDPDNFSIPTFDEEIEQADERVAHGDPAPSKAVDADSIVSFESHKEDELYPMPMLDRSDTQYMGSDSNA